MKAYTNIEQSKKLAEILPLESADMCYIKREINDTFIETPILKPIGGVEKSLCCWSLAALLDVLPLPQLSEDKLGSGKVGWMVSAYPNGCRYDSEWHDNPVDACVEMILKLHELNML